MSVADSERARTSSRGDSKQRLRLWLRILRASRVVEAELRERLRVAYGITLPQFDVMAALARRPDGCTMTELSRYLMVSNGNVTGIIDRLATDALVSREAAAGDRRAVMVRLTAKGTRQFEVMAAQHERWVDELMGDVPRGRADTMIDELGGLARRIREDNGK